MINKNTILSYISIAMRPAVFGTAVRVALVVGTILALINHSQAIFALSLSPQTILQMLLTYLVPYSVSTYSSVKFIIIEEGLILKQGPE